MSLWFEYCISFYVHIFCLFAAFNLFFIQHFHFVFGCVWTRLIFYHSFTIGKIFFHSLSVFCSIPQMWIEIVYTDKLAPPPPQSTLLCMAMVRCWYFFCCWFCFIFPTLFYTLCSFWHFDFFSSCVVLAFIEMTQPWLEANFNAKKIFILSFLIFFFTRLFVTVWCKCALRTNVYHIPFRKCTTLYLYALCVNTRVNKQAIQAATEGSQLHTPNSQPSKHFVHSFFSSFSIVSFRFLFFYFSIWIEKQLFTYILMKALLYIALQPNDKHQRRGKIAFSVRT